jgi:hypothetical protein
VESASGFSTNHPIRHRVCCRWREKVLEQEPKRAVQLNAVEATSIARP